MGIKANLQTGSSIFILRCIRMEAGTVFSINWSIDWEKKMTLTIISQMKNRNLNILLKETVFMLTFDLITKARHRAQVSWDEQQLNLTSSPRASSISLFSRSPGPMCLSAKSSCLGNILSICLEETAADVLRARAAVVRDAPLFRILHWSFQTTRLLSLRCLHGALGFTDLAKKIPQDLAQLCISKPLSKDKSAETGEALSSRRSAQFFLHCDWDAVLAAESANSFKLQSLYNCTVAQARANQSADAAWRSDEPRSNSC